MRSPKSLIRLPRGTELQSTKLGDIQRFLDRQRTVLDEAWKLLFQDVAVFQVDEDGYIYFGNKDTDGSWRIGRDGADWVIEHRDAGTWTTTEKSKAS